MSKYTNYEKVSQTYDSIRYASGVDVMTNVLSGILKMTPGEISMLETGCGTGNYSHGFLQNGIGQLTMFDASGGMLERAKEKVKDYDNQVKEIRQHKLPILPYPDESYDCVAFIQVLHHLDTYHLKDDEQNGHEAQNGHKDQNGFSNDHNGECNGNMNGIEAMKLRKKKYPNLIHALNEAFRVLKPNGVLMIDHSFDFNIDSLWISMAPKATALFKKAFISGSVLIDILRDNNYENIFCVTRPGSSCARTGCFDNPELVLDEKWRNCMSEWSFVERTGELSEILDLVRKKKEEGTLEQFAYEQNKIFRLHGEATTLFARKP